MATQPWREDGYRKSCLFMLDCIAAKLAYFSTSEVEVNALTVANEYWRDQLVSDSILTAERCNCWEYHKAINKSNHQQKSENLLSLRIIICVLYPEEDPASGSDYLIDVLDCFIGFFMEKFSDSEELILSSLKIH
ncbi:MAG: hypothetical protein AAF889_14945, partial [Cyanobacteria bacterium P01_D01_bin.73]